MAENYSIGVAGSGITFEPLDKPLPEVATSTAFDPAKAPKDLAVVCRMGAPDLLHCVIFRWEGRAGGIFALHEQGKVLFAAIAETELAYTLAKGFFGELVASTRFGVDIFEADMADD